MMLGEHAVLRGRLGLCCAVNKRLAVTLTPRADDVVQISSALGELRSTICALSIQKPFAFVSQAIITVRDRLRCGFELFIESDFSDKIGFGSSAAVTAGTTACLALLLGDAIEKQGLLARSRATVRAVQGFGSGYDLATSIFGGVIKYQAETLSVEKFEVDHPITVIYSGEKIPTTEVVALVNSRYDRHPELVDGVFDLMHASVAHAVAAIERRDWREFGEILNYNQGLMDALGLSNTALSEIVYALRRDPAVLGAKISGSGLGDCVIGWGEFGGVIPYEQIEVSIDQDGLRIE
jgi:mevalonate kinase